MTRVLVVAIAVAAALASAAVRGDTTVAPPSPPSWKTACIRALERARDEIEPIRTGAVRAEVSVSELPPHELSSDCVRGSFVSIALRNDVNATSSARFRAEVEINQSLVNTAVPWTRRSDKTEDTWIRRELGRAAAIVVDKSEAGGRVAARFRPALDFCLGAAPPPPSPLPPMPKLGELELDATCATAKHSLACADAEQAAWQLEHLCRVEGAAVGAGGGPGRTEPWLARITSSIYSATPILLRLARSPNPAARAAAAMGLSEVRSDAGRAALQSLAGDRELVSTIYGCMGSDESVASFARDALKRY